MDFNCILDDFSFVGTAIKEFHLDNELLVLDGSAEKKLAFDIINPIFEVKDEQRVGSIQIKIHLEIWHEKKLTDMSMLIEGCFVSPISVDEELFKQYVLINGATALYGIARAKVESISATVFFDGKIVLPFINVIKYYEERDVIKKEES